jgi:tripartite-type tricarboxylate transporter receptor subunit TctC
MTRSLRALTAIVCAIAVHSPCGLPVRAQEYPSRMIRWVVPVPAGSPTDVWARKFAAAMGEKLKGTIIVDNKPCGATTIGATEVARAQPDGYTLMFAPNEPLVGGTVLIAKLAYNPTKDFSFITRLTESHPVLIAAKSVKANSLAELADEAKRTAGGLAYGSFGFGTFPHVILESFARKTGAQFVHVPYQGSPPAIQDLLGDRIALTFGNHTIVPQLDAGQLKVLAQTGSSRFWIRDVPTFAEQGFDDPIFRYVIWNGLVGPAGLPGDVIEKNVAAARAAIAAPELAAYFKEISTQLVGSSPEEFEKQWRVEYETIPPLMRSLGITAN